MTNKEKAPVPEIFWVTPRLGIADAQNGIYAANTGHLTVANVAGEVDNPKANVQLPLLPFACEKSKLDFLTNWINHWIHNEPGRLVVHCFHGLDRSPLVIAWYLYRFRDMTLDEAYEKIRLVRPTVNDRRDWVVTIAPYTIEEKSSGD